MNKRGISPVIATIIIVAVAIAISIAVAFWITGIAGLFTRYEKLEIQYIYASGSTTDGWDINLRIKNTGSATATIDQIFLNGKPWDEYTGLGMNDSSSRFEPFTLNPGSEAKYKISIPSSSKEFVSGMTVEVKLHTVAGQEYYKAVVLP